MNLFSSKKYININSDLQLGTIFTATLSVVWQSSLGQHNIDLELAVYV